MLTQQPKKYLVEEKEKKNCSVQALAFTTARPFTSGRLFGAGSKSLKVFGRLCEK